MCYTVRRKLGLVDASKHMQAEGITLRADASELHFPSKSVAATPSPGHFSPNPSVLRLTVMFLPLATGRSD